MALGPDCWQWCASSSWTTVGSIMRTLPLALLLLCSPVTAQTATYTYVDQRGPYANPTTPLTALTVPRIGTTFKVQTVLTGGRYDVYYLLTGVGNPNIRIDVLGGYLFTTADFITHLFGVPGPRVWSIAVPNSSALVGGRFYQQVLYFSRTPVELSRGGVGTIGK